MYEGKGITDVKPDIDVQQYWEIPLQRIEPFLDGQKNPRRRSNSWVVNSNFLLRAEESLLYDRRQKEEKLISILNKQGIPVLPSIGNKIIRGNDKIYQLFPFVSQKEQGRIDYKKELNKATQAGSVLAAITNLKAEGLDDLAGGRQPTLGEIIEELWRRLSTKGSIITGMVKPAYDHLKKTFFPYLPYWEKSFSHGDLHPANILWESETKLRAVIDWEQAGTREELYDLAFLIGCVGLDHPSELTGEWTKKLIRSFLSGTQTTKLSFELLPELVLATRIHWMVVWSSTPQDGEIAELEAAYWQMIIANSESLRSEWSSCHDGDFKLSKSRWVVQDASLMEEIDQAKKRQEGVDIFLPATGIKDTYETELLSTDLRLIAIDKGMNDDIRSVCAIINQQGNLLKKYPENDYLKIERSLTMGNSTLDFSKFRMMRAVRLMLEECKKLMDKSPTRKELQTGYAFALRNTSIALAEVGEYDNAMEVVETLIQLSLKNPENLDIKEELARALSNALTSMIIQNKDNILGAHFQKWTGLLEDLYYLHPDSRKITGAYLVAEKNLKKAGAKGKPMSW